MLHNKPLAVVVLLISIVWLLEPLLFPYEALISIIAYIAVLLLPVKQSQ